MADEIKQQKEKKKKKNIQIWKRSTTMKTFLLLPTLIGKKNQKFNIQC